MYNPAVAGGIEQKELFVVSELGIAEDKLGCAIMAWPLGRWSIAGGLGYYDAGQVELNWIENGVLKTQSATLQRDLFGILSLQYRLMKDLCAGLSLKAASSEIVQKYAANAYAADAGIFYQPSRNYALSVALQNAGEATKFINRANPLPLAVYVGNSYVWDWELGQRFIVSQAGVTGYADDRRVIPEIGFEVGYLPIAFNAGYRFGGDDESNLHLGVTFNAGNIEVGYAFLPGINLNSVNRISLAYRFEPSVLTATMKYVPAPRLQEQLSAPASAHKASQKNSAIKAPSKSTAKTSQPRTKPKQTKKRINISTDGEWYR